MGRLVKCPYCEKKLDKDEAHPHNKRYYHQKCFETMQHERDDYNSLLDYVVELFGEDKPIMLLKKQIKDMKDEGYKYKGMELALRYFFDTLGNKVRENTGVGIIPYVYEDAKQQYITVKRVESSIKNIDNVSESRIVVVKSPKNNFKKTSEIIDINSL